MRGRLRRDEEDARSGDVVRCGVAAEEVPLADLHPRDRHHVVGGRAGQRWHQTVRVRRHRSPR